MFLNLTRILLGAALSLAVLQIQAMEFALNYDTGIWSPTDGKTLWAANDEPVTDALRHGSADLWDVYQLAVKNDPAFQADRLTYEADLQNEVQARALLLPTISVTGVRVRNRDKLTAPDVPFSVGGRAYFDSNAYSLSLRQPVYDQVKILGYRQARAASKSAAIQFQIDSQNLILRVAVRYLAVLAAQDNLGLASAERKAVARQLELADERLQVGLGTSTDLYDAQARFRLAEAEEISARKLLDDARQALAELIGQVPERLRAIKADAPLSPPVPDNLQAWVSSAYAGNLDLALSQQTAGVAEQEIRLQRAGHYPSLDFVVTHNVNDAKGSISGPGSESTVTDALLELSIPLVQGGAVVSRTKEARLRYEAALRDVEAARRAAERNTRAEYLDVISNIRRVEALDQAVTASKSALEAKEEGFAAGLNTNLDVLDAQRDLFRAERDHLKARYDYILNRLRLKQVVGALRESDLRQASNWLE